MSDKFKNRDLATRVSTKNEGIGRGSTFSLYIRAAKIQMQYNMDRGSQLRGQKGSCVAIGGLGKKWEGTQTERVVVWLVAILNLSPHPHLFTMHSKNKMLARLRTNFS